jgi:ABC-type antimicrobial peptide transport system permease subunit
MTSSGNASPSDSGVAKKRPAISRQVVLPFRKSVQIAFNNIKVRFFRSLITTLSLVLAVAFFGFVNVSIDVANGLLHSDHPQARELLNAAGFDVGEDDGNSADSSSKQRWLVILSLLVCTVGIVNAQLMAVTERFREIGTMKCLGALDRFILRLFLLEAVMQGLAGAIIGALLGSAVAIGVGVIRFGLIALEALPVAGILSSIGIASAIGCLLSLIGVFYPALVAARMQPVEAMRAEH